MKMEEKSTTSEKTYPFKCDMEKEKTVQVKYDTD